MPAQFTLPPDSRAVGSGNPPADMNGVVDALTAMGAGYNVLNASFAGGADPAGVADSAAAIAAAVAAAQATGGTVILPPGTYSISSNPFAPASGGPYSVMGAGRAATVIKPSASFTGSYAMDLTFTVGAAGVQLRDFYLNMVSAPTLNGIRIGDSTGGQQASRAVIQNVRTNYGATALTIEGGTTVFSVRNFYPQNMTVSGLHITNSYATSQPNGDLDNILVTNTDNTVTTTQGVLIDCFTTGISMKNVRVLGTASSVFSAGIVYNTAAPTGGNGAFIQAVNCITDGITGPGLSLTNCRQFQSTNNFWSALFSTANYGVALSAGQYFRFVNDEISGCGVSYASAPDDIAYTTCEFPYTGTVPGVHNMPGSNPPTNLQIDRQSLAGKNGAGYQLTNNLQKFWTALTDPAAIGAVPVQLTSGPIFETFPATLVNTNSTTLTLGSVFMQRIWLPKGLPVTNIVWCSGATLLTAGSGIHYWAALYAASGGLAAGAALAQSTDNTSPTIAASTIQVLPLSAGYVTLASGYYYLGLCLNQTGGTAPTVMNFAGISAFTNLSPKVGYVEATAYNSATAPSASGSAASLGNQFWMGVS